MADLKKADKVEDRVKAGDVLTFRELIAKRYFYINPSEGLRDIFADGEALDRRVLAEYDVMNKKYVVLKLYDITPKNRGGK